MNLNSQKKYYKCFKMVNNMYKSYRLMGNPQIPPTDNVCISTAFLRGWFP